MKGSGVFTKAIVDRIKYHFENDHYVKFHVEAPETKVVAVSYLLGGIVYTYHDWLEGKLKCSLEELSLYLSGHTKELPFYVRGQ